MVRTPRFHCPGPSSITGWETKIPHLSCVAQKNKKFQREWKRNLRKKKKKQFSKLENKDGKGRNDKDKVVFF